MPDIDLDPGDLGFLAELPRTIKRGVWGQSDAMEDADNRRIRRLQSRGLLRCVVDTEQSVGRFIVATLLLTDAGRAVLARDAVPT